MDLLRGKKGDEREKERERERNIQGNKERMIESVESVTCVKVIQKKLFIVETEDEKSRERERPWAG